MDRELRVYQFIGALALVSLGVYLEFFTDVSRVMFTLIMLGMVVVEAVTVILIQVVPALVQLGFRALRRLAR